MSDASFSSGDNVLPYTGLLLASISVAEQLRMIYLLAYITKASLELSMAHIQRVYSLKK
jgi:hypothetical protein